MVNNSTNINTPNNYLTALIIEHEWPRPLMKAIQFRYWDMRKIR